MRSTNLMPQSRLPDINNAFVSYRNDFKTAISKENFASAMGSLQVLNALLPIEYRVRISGEEYHRLAKTKTYKKCLHCEEESEDEITHVKEILTNSMSSFLLDAKSERLWYCPKCNEWNNIINTPRINQVLDSTMVFGVVPEPPTREAGVASINPIKDESGRFLSNEKRFNFQMKDWLWKFDREIEERIAQYRDDNWQKEQAMNESEVDTSMEE